MFLWCVFVVALPAREKIGKKVAGLEDVCVVCGECLESSLHLFKKCPAFRALAFSSNWGGRTNEWQVSNLDELWEFCFNPPMEVYKGIMDKTSFLSLMVSLFYSFWKFRNDCLFEGKYSLFEVRK